MKKMLLMGLAVIASLAWAQEAQKMSLADARKMIGDAVNDPAVMTKTVSQLSPEDQVTFLAEVNEAIKNMPGSSEQKAAAYLNANSAAMVGARDSGNLAKMLAEVFATVPVEVLTVINEKFANDFFSRSSDDGIRDDKFVEVVQNTMKTISDRAAQSDNAGVRETFAAMMFLRASNGSPANLADTLVVGLPPTVQEKAQTTWIPDAMGAVPNYESILGAADAGEAPAMDKVAPMQLRTARSEFLTSMLSDLASDGTMVYDSSQASSEQESRSGNGGSSSGGSDTVPRTTDPTSPAYPGEPRGYKGQTVG